MIKLINGNVVIMLFVLGLLIRIILLPFINGDVETFLIPWVDYFRENGLTRGLSVVHESCNYMPLYTYFLYPVSLLPSQYTVYGIKLISLTFDVCLCYGVAFLLREIDDKCSDLNAIASIMWVVPTMFWNSCYLGQCDAIYTFFCVLTISFVIKARPWVACVMYGLSLALKMQCVFLLPVLFVAMLHKRVQIWHYIMVPIVVFCTVIPSLLSGRPLIEILSLYSGQTVQYQGLTFNLANPYIFISDDYYEPVRLIGICTTVVVTLLFGFWLRPSQTRLTKEILLLISLTGALYVPYLLPCMHERYLYLGDMLTVAYFILKGSKVSFEIAILTVGTSFYEYGRLTRWHDVLPEWPVFITYTAAIILALKQLYNEKKV